MQRPFKHSLLSALLLGGASLATPASATCTAEPYLASICMTAATFCPIGYLETNGQLLAISEYDALFAIIGTTYGGDGQATFGVPDLRGRSPRGSGAGPGLAQVMDGQVGGTESLTLLASQMPAHAHIALLRSSSAPGETTHPAGAVPARASAPAHSRATPDVTMRSGAATLAASGGSQPVDIMNPSLGQRFCIAVYGIFPPRP